MKSGASSIHLYGSRNMRNHNIEKFGFIDWNNLYSVSLLHLPILQNYNIDSSATEINTAEVSQNTLMQVWFFYAC